MYIILTQNSMIPLSSLNINILSWSSPTPNISSSRGSKGWRKWWLLIVPHRSHPRSLVNSLHPLNFKVLAFFTPSRHQSYLRVQIPSNRSQFPLLSPSITLSTIFFKKMYLIFPKLSINQSWNPFKSNSIAQKINLPWIIWSMTWIMLISKKYWKNIKKL